MIYSNMKRYTAKGERVAVFGEEKEGKLEIFILKCSKKDHFSKDLARQVYVAPNAELNGVKYHPLIYRIDITDNKPKYTFLKHVSENFYRKTTALIDGVLPGNIDSIATQKKLSGLRIIASYYTK